MKKHIRTILILAMILLSSVSVFAQTPPRVDDDYYECAVYYNGMRTNETAYTIKGNVYVSIDTLRKYGNIDNFTVDTMALKMIFDPADFNIYVADRETSDFIRRYAGEMYLQLKNIYGEYYVSIGSVAQMAGLTYSYEDYMLSLTSRSAGTKFGIIGENGALSAGSLISGSGENEWLDAGEIAFIFGETRSFIQIQTLSGDVRYVNKKDIMEAAAGEVAFDYIAGKRKPKDYGNTKINLVWVEGGVRTDLCPADKGIDVLSPCWFVVQNDGGGTVKNYCDFGFVELAHVQGCEVWGCANDFGNNTKSSYICNLLADETTRNRQIAQYLMYASLYNLDGINIDYETIIYYKANFTTFAEFMSTLSRYCGRMGLKLSVDTNVPTSNNQQCFDFVTLGKVCDYVIPMTYEQYNGRTTACSVADRNYYTTWTTELAKLVPPEKIMMGVPFYGVSWVYKTDGSFDYKSALTMDTQRDRITENSVVPEWDEHIGQYYAEYYAYNDGKLRRMYIENARSIAQRLEYIIDAGFAGSACWRYGQQEQGVLDVFYHMFRQRASASDFDMPY